MYIYNPGEPAGVNFQPFPVVDNAFLNSQVNSQTRGRCGNCRHCPRVWKLEIPHEGNGFFTGTYYLYRNSYSLDGGGIRYTEVPCMWSSTWLHVAGGCPIAGVNTFNGSDNVGWRLEFAVDPDVNAYNWYLYTPIYYEDGLVSHQSLFRYPALLNNYRCLHNNVFTFWDRIAEFPYQISAEQLTLTPYYA